MPSWRKLQGIENVYQGHIHACSFKTVENQTLRYSFKAAADTTGEDKLYL